MNRQGIVYTIIFTFVAAFFFVLILSLTNELTGERVALNQNLRKRRAILNAIGIAVQGGEADYKMYDARVKERIVDGAQLFEAVVDGQTVLAIQFAGSGLWGVITGVLAVNDGFSQVIGIDIISHNETPGLGGRIDEAWFKEQFRGETLVEGRIRVAGAGDGDADRNNGRVDAITGASRTSQALDTILNRSLAAIRELWGTD